MARFMIEVSRKEVLQQAGLHTDENEEERKMRLRRAKLYFGSWQRAQDPAVAGPPSSSSRAPRARGPVRRARRPRTAPAAVTGETL